MKLLNVDVIALLLCNFLLIAPFETYPRDASDVESTIGTIFIKVKVVLPQTTTSSCLKN